MFLTCRGLRWLVHGKCFPSVYVLYREAQSSVVLSLEPVVNMASSLHTVLPDCDEARGVADIEKDESQYVCTPDFKDATELLKKQGQVVLCGPPGCGKTTLANALLRECREDGFVPYIISSLEKWDEDLVVGKSAVLLDCTLGTVCMDSQQYHLWRRMQSAVMDKVEKGYCRFIIVLYPHMLREVRKLEDGAHSPLSNHSLVVQVGNWLKKSAKEKLLSFHLKKLSLETAELDVLMETILQTERSGRLFPWCCRYLLKHWQCSKDPAIFRAPEETQALLLKDMVAHDTHGKHFAAVLVLTMQGFHGFLNMPLQVQPVLRRLGFGNHSDDVLAAYADVLRGSILTETGKGFSSRVLYDAAALAVGRSFCLTTMLRACDVTFLVQHVRTSVAAEKKDGERASKLAMTVGLPACGCEAGPGEATPTNLQSLTEKVCEEIMSGHLPEICQHPSLQCPEFLLALEDYCLTHSGDHSVQHLVSVLDTVHCLPLVYWSVFNRHDTLTQWCLRHMRQTGQKLLSLPVLLACAVFDQLVGSSKSRLKPLLLDALPSKWFSYQTDTVELPLLGRGQCLIPESRDFRDTITGTGPGQRILSYLCNPSLPIPAEVISVQMSDEKVTVQVRDRQWWRLVHRLLADREVDWRDQEGNTLLHQAIGMAGREIIQLAVKSGCSLLEKNGQGETAYQLAQKRRDKQRPKDDICVYDYLHAVYVGNDVKVKTLLCYHVSVQDKDRHGDTGLHVACREGQENIADSLIQLGADVNIKNNDHHIPLYYAFQSNNPSLIRLLVKSGSEVSEVLQTVVQGDVDTLETLIQQGADVNQQDPSMECSLLHVACMVGHSDLVTCLVGHRAQVNAVDSASCTPLHQACGQGHTQIVQYLILQGADINISDEEKVTPLHIACDKGLTETALCLIQHGALVNAKDSAQDTPLHEACENDDHLTAVCLIQNGADVHAEDWIHSTPLHKACENGHHKTVLCLIQHGACVNAGDRFKATPLHRACWGGDHQTVQCLIQHGASVNIISLHQDSPLDMARRRRHDKIVQLLIKHGGKQECHVLLL